MAAWRYEIPLLVLKNISLVLTQHSKRNFVSPCSHVISSISFWDETFTLFYETTLTIHVSILMCQLTGYVTFVEIKISNLDPQL